jgi:hypothetical protein
MKCTCGIYGSKDLDRLRRSQYWQFGGVHGEVNLWGSVVEHERGFRAQFAYPKTLHLPSEMLPVTLKKIQTRIQALVGYGCDLFIAHNTSGIPLWRKGSALDAGELEFLISRGNECRHGAHMREPSSRATASLYSAVALHWSSK